jgi:hypothetical protein
LLLDAIAPTIAITMSDTTLSTGETTAVTFTFSEALAVGKNIDNVLESVANANVRNHLFPSIQPEVIKSEVLSIELIRSVCADPAEALL